MSFETSENTIITAIEALNYKRVPRETRMEDAPDNFNHRQYTLFYEGFQPQNITSDCTGGLGITELQVMYTLEAEKNIRTETQVFDESKTLFDAVYVLSYGYQEQPTVQPAPTNHKKIICTAKFYLGVT